MAFTRPTPVRHNLGDVPEILSGKYKTAEAILIGSLLQLDANGELILAVGADPVDLVGVAQEPAGSKPGWDLANAAQTTVVTGRVQEVSYAVINENTVFVMRAETATVLTAPLQTNVGKGYGIIINGTEWRIDLADTTNKRVTVVDWDQTNGLFFVKFTPAALLIP
jgi:hypothetical protein